jgi:hypothetical protein
MVKSGLNPQLTRICENMETQTETIKKEKAEVNPLFQRENTTKIDDLIKWWKEQPDHHVNMRKVNPPQNYKDMDTEPILMYKNKPVCWLEYRAGAWFGFSHYLGGFKTKDTKFPRIHNEEELNDLKKHYLEPRKKEILKNLEKAKKTAKKTHS